MRDDLKTRQAGAAHAIVLPTRHPNWGERSVRFLLLVATLAAIGGCAMVNRDYVNVESGLYNNLGEYMTFEHPFTEAGAANAGKRAERHCREIKRVALMTRRVCTMTTCTVDYQCMTADEAARAAPAELKK